jgi:hypothetical protein
MWLMLWRVAFGFLVCVLWLVACGHGLWPWLVAVAVPGHLACGLWLVACGLWLVAVACGLWLNERQRRAKYLSIPTNTLQHNSSIFCNFSLQAETFKLCGVE